MELRSIELFSGVGMLGEGLRAGLRHLGIETRTVLHVEREAYPASVLAARMAEGSLDEAAIWTDVCTFDAAAWRDRVDCIVAGFPCQDLSVAGRRAGLDGKRSGLFFEVTRIATDSGAWLMFLENVGGIATATASVVDPEEGELDERAASRVVGELADLGWDAEWITVSASDVGASHGRARWFCLAWRNLADAAWHERPDSGRKAGCGRGVRETGNKLAHATGRNRRELARPDQRGLPQSHGGSAEAAAVEQSESLRRKERRPESTGQQGRLDVAVDGGSVAYPSSKGRGCAQGGNQPGQCSLEEQGGSRGGECSRDAVGRPEVISLGMAHAGRQGLSQRVGGGGGASCPSA